LLKQIPSELTGVEPVWVQAVKQKTNLPTSWKPFRGRVFAELPIEDAMPTLFRLLVVLIFLAGLVYAGMFALVAFVEPNSKEVSMRIPTRELLKETAPTRPAGLPTPNVTSTPRETPRP
jgi:hypothetical protein